MKLLYSIKQGEQYTKTSNNGPSEKQRTSVQRTDSRVTCPRLIELRTSENRTAGPAPPVRLVRFQPDHFLTADLGNYDVRGSIDERSTGSTELAA